MENMRLPTKKQKGFVRDFVTTGNGSMAAKNNYNTESMGVAAVIASENLRKPNIKALIEDMAEKAAKRVEQLSYQEDNLPVALGASKDILDRAGYKPVEKSEVKSLSMNVDITDPKAKVLKEKYELELLKLMSHED